MSGINGFPGFISDFVRGTTKDLYISIKKDGAAVDIADCKFYITISEYIDPTVDPALEITVDPPTSPAQGETKVTITDTETFALKARVYYYSVRFVNSAGASYVIDMGKFTVAESLSDRLE